jgi:CHASE1-domain containing sensor protein
MDLSPLAQYLGGIGLVAVIIVMLFLKFQTTENRRKKDEHDKDAERDKEITILKTQVESMRFQVAHLEDRASNNTDALYAKINEVKELLMSMQINLAQHYVTKTECEKHH